MLASPGFTCEGHSKCCGNGKVHMWNTRSKIWKVQLLLSAGDNGGIWIHHFTVE